MSEGKPITFHATVHKVQTVIDGGVRVTLDVPESDAKAAFELVHLRDQVLGIAIAKGDC